MLEQETHTFYLQYTYLHAFFSSGRCYSAWLKCIFVLRCVGRLAATNAVRRWFKAIRVFFSERLCSAGHGVNKLLSTRAYIHYSTVCVPRCTAVSIFCFYVH